MYEINWAQKDRWLREKSDFPRKSQLSSQSIRQALLLRWEDHCLECGAPICYKTCRLFRERKDKECSRFAYGIYPNPNFNGFFNFGADIRFLKWAKLEANLNQFGMKASAPLIIFFQNVYLNLFLHHLAGISGKLRNSLYSIRNKTLGKKSGLDIKDAFDEFVIECFSPEEKASRLILEYVAHKKIQFRDSFEILPGKNFITILSHAFPFDPTSPEELIRIYPEDHNKETRVIFTWLDFVQYKQTDKKKYAKQEPDSIEPASKVKCVAWDLDNTLWKGILVEDSAENLTVNREVIELIHQFDERGVIQTVVSKNNFDEAWEVIKKNDLQDYFIYPAINWGQKSENLKEIARNININIDTFALIDDSPFEREEVKTALPQTRVYDIVRISELLDLPEFDVPVTETSKIRRLSYLSQIKRERVKASFTGDYDTFLQSCEMKMSIFIPGDKDQIVRCWELIQRSNQLNLSARRYSEEEFDALLSNKEMLCVAISCKDKFGDYGIVGFSSINVATVNMALHDFVLSCRVAQKRVEHTFFKWLSEKGKASGKEMLTAYLIKTDRNTPLRQVFNDMPFKMIEEKGDSIVMELDLKERIVTNDVVQIIYSDIEF